MHKYVCIYLVYAKYAMQACVLRAKKNYITNSKMPHNKILIT